MARTEEARHIRAISSLDDRVRRALYDHVVREGAEVSRDDAARALGISRSLAVFHLDRLVRDGLLEATYRRLGERTGRGAGRPSKLYRRAPATFAVSLPRRDYELAARLLLQATIAPQTADAADALERGARDLGRELGESLGHPQGGSAADRMVEVLERQGFEPAFDADGTLFLRNCPFHTLALSRPETICAMNRALVEGVLEGVGADGVDAVLDPQPGRCCVAVVPRRARPVAAVPT